MTDNMQKQAQQFLQILDPSADSFTFQTFDNTKEKRPKLTRILNGKLDEYWDRLCLLNDQEAGIYVTFNQTDLKGRKKGNITHYRGVYFENDAGIDPGTLPLKPTLIVQTSPGRNHLYFLTLAAPPVTDKTTKQFTAMMRYMVAQGSDKNAKDVARVLRVPGFENHSHKNPFDVRIAEFSDKYYTWDQLVAAFDGDVVEDTDFFKETDDGPKEPFLCAKVFSALRAIDPDCEYDTWLKLGMAIHHASSGNKLGYKIFHEWSKRGDKYNANDWPQKWKTFKQTGENIVQIGTLYRIAKEFSWDGNYVSDGPAAGFYIKYERDNVFKDLNIRYGFVASGSRPRIVSMRQNDVGEWYFVLQEPKTLEALHANDLIPAVWATPSGQFRFGFKNKFAEWLKWKGRRTYDRLEFMPDKNLAIDLSDPYSLPNTKVFNTYLGLVNSGAAGNWDTIYQHMLEVWCQGNEEALDYVLNWLANMFQYPGRPAGTCVVVKSDRQGVGKNIIADIIVNALGIHGVTLSTSKHITGSFNSIMAESVFTVLAEAVWAGNFDAKSFLKSAITDPWIISEKKFEDARKIRNCTHLMCLSNEQWVVPVEPGDRRYFILNCDNKYAQHYEYFDILADRIKDGEGDAFIHHLRNRDISKFNRFEIPYIEDEVKLENMERSFNDIEAFILEALRQGDFLFALGDLTESTQEDETTLRYSKHSVYASYTTFFEKHKQWGWRLTNTVWFGRRLKKYLGGWKNVKWTTERGDDGETTSMYQMMPIPVLRKAFEKHLGTFIDWSE